MLICVFVNGNFAFLRNVKRQYLIYSKMFSVGCHYILILTVENLVWLSCMVVYRIRLIWKISIHSNETNVRVEINNSEWITFVCAARYFNWSTTGIEIRWKTFDWRWRERISTSSRSCSNRLFVKRHVNLFFFGLCRSILEWSRSTRSCRLSKEWRKKNGVFLRTWYFGAIFEEIQSLHDYSFPSS
mgnify:CR=1 FL=1